MKRGVWIVLGALLILCGVVFLVYSQKASISGQTIKASGAAVPTQSVAITYDNIASYLSQSPMVKSLPEDGVLMLKFFNFNRGERVWEKSYVLKKEGVEEGFVANPDVILTLHSKYLNEMNTNNFCSVISKANANGDLGFESSLSRAKLSWKFRSLFDYRDCFGF